MRYINWPIRVASDEKNGPESGPGAEKNQPLIDIMKAVPGRVYLLSGNVQLSL
jgi:hypothetical protein